MYSPCGLFVRMGSGIIWPLLSKLTFLWQKETCWLLAQVRHVVLESQLLPCLCVWTCHTVSATSCSVSVPYGLVDDEHQADKRNRGNQCSEVACRIPQPPATELEQAT